MAIRIRKNVYEISIVETALTWYARAVEEMKSRPVNDPTSWWYMGAVHGNPNLEPRPSNAGTYWDQCQHQSWFFLPWHRGYITAFEDMVAKTVASLGGPDDWSLPYWDYSESLLSNPEARRIPPDFRDQFYADGTANPLWAPRSADANGNIGLRDADVDLGALGQPIFTDPTGFAPGFGGPATGFNHFGSVNGALESVPHNIVHVRIGGWMQDPNTAGFDPIFWLHHCNIDRLWEEWLLANMTHGNPLDPAWLNGVSFDMHDGNGNAFTFTADQTQDTTTFMHGYMYDKISTAPFAGPFAGRTEGATILAQVEPELAGTSRSAVRLEGALTTAPVAMETARLSRSFTESALPTPVKVYLRLENVTGTGLPGDYEVLIDLDGDDIDPLPVGILTTFGVANASKPEGPHGGEGVTQVYDISYAAQRLKLTEEIAPKIQVSFREIENGPVPENARILFPGFELPDPEPASVEVGRVAIYFE
ncbi:tyrosinase family protein [Ferrimonas balearica]|nr:tyrosinase family protein [Ferrimonas balearica]